MFVYIFKLVSSASDGTNAICQSAAQEIFRQTAILSLQMTFPAKTERFQRAGVTAVRCFTTTAKMHYNLYLQQSR